RVAALGLRVGGGLALEVGAGNVVEQQVVLQAEQAPQPPLQVQFQHRLVRQQPVQGAVEPVVVDLVVGDAQQVAQGGAAEPVLGDVQFAGRLAEAGQDQDGGHLGPGHVLAPRPQPAVEQGVQVQGLPQPPAQPDVAEAAAALQPEAAQLDGDGL